MWKRLRQPLSVKEMVGTTIVVVLAGASLYGVYLGVSATIHRWRLEKNIPAALEGIRAEREDLVKIIQSYKNHFGYYPPMFTKEGPDRGVVNPLCYELLGVRRDPKTKEFYIPITKDGLPSEEVQKYFNAYSFSNCLTFPTPPTNFLANRALAVEPMISDFELFGVGLSYTEFIPEPFWGDFEFTAWRYATNPAKHNPDKFDVWVEVTVAGKHFTVGNWPEVK